MKVEIRCNQCEHIRDATSDLLVREEGICEVRADPCPQCLEKAEADAVDLYIQNEQHPESKR